MMTPQLTSQEPRIQSIDCLRGAVMLLMAIDHVRVYSGIPAGGETAGIFFTRWVTHFCVPVFVFLAGTSAFLFEKKSNSKKALTNFLISRGLILVLLELTVIRFCWTFNFHYAQFTLAGVIWMLGWCMLLLAAFIRLPVAAIAVFGLFVIAFQQLFSYLPGLLPHSIQKIAGMIWEFFYPSGSTTSTGITILYTIVPWIGVMAVGYAFGTIMIKEYAARRKLCLVVGIVATAAFIIAGSIIASRQTVSPDSPTLLFRLLNQRKYPASLLYLLMTLGPAIALIPFAEKAHGWLARLLVTFGRVPMFYYLLHIPLIHIIALIVQSFRKGGVHTEWYANAPYVWIPEQYRWELPLLYLVFIVAVLILYFACRWYGKYKFEHPELKWLKYL
jgi:uncharacterized membrane protein